MSGIVEHALADLIIESIGTPHDEKASEMQVAQEEIIGPDYDMTDKEATVLLSVNAIFGSLFVIAWCATIAMIVRREINDLFLRYALICLIVALALSAVMCFIITSYTSQSYLNEQTIPFQQVYFEVPFYMFLVVIASILFSWQEAYELYVLQCTDDESSKQKSTDDIFLETP